MTQGGSNVLELLEQLGTEPVPEVAAEHQLAQRRRVVRSINELAEYTRKRGAPSTRTPGKHAPKNPGARRRTRLFPVYAAALSLAAAAATVAIVWTVSRGPVVNAPLAELPRNVGEALTIDGSARVVHKQGATEGLTVAAAVLAGDLVLTDAATHVELGLSTGIRVQLSAETHLRIGDLLSSPHSRVWLTRGSARFDVQARPANGSFAVLTADSEVTVHGTSFRIELRDSAEGMRTFVAVEDGLVSVRASGKVDWLRAGETWISGGTSQAVTPPSTAPATTCSAAPARSSRAAARGGTAPPATTQSTLQIETQAYQAAMGAKRSGQDANALHQLDEFLATYPASALAPNARVERFRLLKRLGRDVEAAAAARSYMAEDPNGFAREEARGIAISPSPAGSQ